MTEPRYLDVPGCAAYIGRTEGAVRKLVYRGQIPCVKIGVRIQFDREKIDRWFERHSRRAAGSFTV